MKNRILQLKMLVCATGIALLMAGNASAQLVYETDFGVTDEYDQSSTSVVFDDGTTTAVEEWFGSNNQVGISGGNLSFANSADNRFRGSGVWLDTTDWAAGLVTVEVDVANFVAGSDTELFFQAYAANGVDALNTVSLDLHGGFGLAGNPQSSGTAAIGTLGAQQAITGNGTDVAFTFNFNGTDEFVGLTFIQENADDGTDFGSADLDDLTVNTSAVPEPSSLAFLVAGVGLINLRRRRLS